MPPFHCSVPSPRGDGRTNGISECKSDNEGPCEGESDIGCHVRLIAIPSSCSGKLENRPITIHAVVANNQGALGSGRPVVQFAVRGVLIRFSGNKSSLILLT